MILNLPMTRKQAWEWYADLHADCTTGSKRYTWQETERELGKRDLFYLLVRLLRRPDVNHPWLFDRCREVQAEPDGCLDLWSRGHYKSSIQTFGKTIQDLISNPEVTIGVFSHTRPIAKGFLLQVKRELEDNEYLKTLYSDVLWQNPQRESPRWSEDGGLIVRRKSNPKESSLESWGLVDGQPTSKHFDILIFDDVVTRESVTTAEQIDKTTKALELSYNLGTTGEHGGRKRFIGTRYSLHDTYADLIKRNSVKVRLYPATSNGRMDGKPVFLSDAEWQGKLRDMSSSTIAAQLLQSPMADESATFRVEWLRSYEVRPRTLNVFILCDPSRGRSAESDNTAMAVVGIAAGGAKFLLDGLCHRMTLSQRWTSLRNLYHKWRRAKGVQHIAVGYERFGAQSDDEYFQEQMRLEQRRGIDHAHFAIEELNWPRDGTQSKRERVERLEPDFRNSRFFLPAPVWTEVQTTDASGRTVNKKGPATWRVDDDPDSKSYGTVLYSPARGLTKQQMAAVEGGSADLVASAIKAVDQDGRPYDVTCHFHSEYSTFPFGQLKDLVDAVSRVYDMEPSPPTLLSRELTEPPQFWDS